MKTLELLDKLKNRAVFRLQDIERLGYCDRKYAKLVMNRLKTNNLIKRVAKNVYTTKDNIFVIASNITYPSYISFWSASYFLGYTEQIVNRIQVVTTRRIRLIKFENYEIEFINTKHFFGYRKVRTDEGEVFVAEDEKLLIDAFLFPKKCGNFDEIEKIFENSKISRNKLVSYLKKVNNQTLIKRVGFLLEKTKSVDVSESFVLDRNYVLLNPFSKKWKKIDPNWRVKV
jgi:predicted transcriptional regulator of viral defense system